MREAACGRGSPLQRNQEAMGVSARSVTISPFKDHGAAEVHPASRLLHSSLLSAATAGEKTLSGKRQTGQMRQAEPSPAIPRSNFL
jgi:hypothetical protein